MKIYTPRACHRGFTLLELLNVIVVIAILALIVIPHLMGVNRKARESRLRADLQQLRKAIALFESDTGEFPATLQDIVAPNKDMLDGADSDMVHEQYRGPYLAPSESIQVSNYVGLPANPFITPTDTTIAHHWTYQKSNGTVKSAVTGMSLDGVAYESL